MNGRSDQGEAGDVWSDWLLGRRHGFDVSCRRNVEVDVATYRDRVLDGARLRPGMTMLDVGSGDGLIALGAVANVGPSLKVILTDISAALLRHVEGIAKMQGIQDQCTFINASAEKLGVLNRATVDVVTTRAVLAYVSKKPAALSEFYRVLKSGGRVSLCEPVFQDQAFETIALQRFIQSQPTNPDLAFLRLLERFRSAQFPSSEQEIATNPLTNYSERDLLQMVRQAGFINIHLELHIDQARSKTTSWDSYLDASPHPWSPTARQIIADRFLPTEQALFEKMMRPVIESGNAMMTNNNVYITADKPQL